MGVKNNLLGYKIWEIFESRFLKELDEDKLRMAVKLLRAVVR